MVAVVDDVLHVEPNAALVAHVDAQSFVVLIPHNKENVYVREQAWRVDGNKAVLVDEKIWQTVQRKRLLGWTPIHEGERWVEWKLDARENDHLTDPERDALIARVTPLAIEHIRESNKFDREGKRRVKVKEQGIVCVSRKEDAFHFWVWTGGVSVPALMLSGEWKEPVIECATLMWSKKKGEIHHSFEWGTREYSGRHNDDIRTFWREEEVLFLDEKLYAKYRRDATIYEEQRELHRKLDAIEDTIVDQAIKELKKARLEQLRARFIEEYEHEELWEDHRKTLNDLDHTPVYPNRIRSAARYVIEREFAATEARTIPRLEMFAGLTYGWLVKAATDLGWTWPPEKPKKTFWPDREFVDSAPVEDQFGLLDKKIAFEDWQRDMENETEDSIPTDIEEGFDGDDEDEGDDMDEDVE
jgi:hypothetical protein